MNRESGGAGYTIGAVNLLIGKAFAATLFRPVPEVLGVPIGKIIDLVPGTKEKQQEGNSFLLLEFFHEAHLVCVDIRQWKGIGSTFFGIDADGNPLYDTDIIDGTFLIEIGQSDVAAFLLDLNRLNGSGNFLDQCQMTFPVLFNGKINQFFECGAAKPSCGPGCHGCSVLLFRCGACCLWLLCSLL